MFFIHLLDNFCENNVDKSKGSQSKFFSILCSKLHQLGILRDIEFLQNLNEYKQTCTNAWIEFLEETLNAKHVKVANEPDLLSSPNNMNSPLIQRTPKRTILSISLDDCHSIESSMSNDLQTPISRYYSDFIEEERLGQGGFGAVFKVTHSLDQLKYAVKKIKFKKANLPTTLPSKILREVRCLARLDHRHVVRYFGAWMEYNRVPNTPPNSSNSLFNKDNNPICGNDFSLSESSCSFQSVTEDDSFKSDHDYAYQGILYIQMQLCSFSLKEWMENQNRTISTEENVSILIQIAKALNYIHTEGLIHRDLKPSNIFVVGYDGTKSLKKACLKIGDFGVATFISDESQINSSQIQNLRHSYPLHHANSEPNIEFSFPGNSNVPTSSAPVHIHQSSEPLQIIPPSPLVHSSSLAYSNRTTGIGTVTYASPEQLRKDNYDEKTDIYSLGIIFLELYFTFKTRMERAEILQNLRKNHILPTSFVSQYPKEASVILLLTNPNPHLRPSAKDLLQFEICVEHMNEEKVCNFHGFFIFLYHLFFFI